MTLAGSSLVRSSAGGPFGLTRREHRRLADVLFNAALHRRAIAPLTARYPELTVSDAARIRDALVARRIDHGERVIGARVAPGTDPVLGWLTDGMVLDGSCVRPGELISPRVEPGVAFRLGRAMPGPDVSRRDLLASVAAVHPCLQILDSRYDCDPPTVADDVADNCATAKLLMGPAAAPERGPRLPDAVLRLASELMASWGELPRDTILVAPTEGAAVPLRGKTRVRVPVRGFDTLDHLELVTLGSRGEHRAQDVAGRLSDA